MTRPPHRLLGALRMEGWRSYPYTCPTCHTPGTVLIGPRTPLPHHTHTDCACRTPIVVVAPSGDPTRPREADDVVSRSR